MCVLVSFHFQDLVETIRPDPPGSPMDQHCSPLPVVSQYMVAFQDGEGRPVACGGIGNLVCIKQKWEKEFNIFKSLFFFKKK